MIAAVLAVFASVQLPAATLTVRQQDLAGSPVAGSMMWCTGLPLARQVRTVVLDVASPPELIVTVWPGAPAGAAWSSVTFTCQPPAGAVPPTATSPPRLTSTPQPVLAAICAAHWSAARALAVAPRSSWVPGSSQARPAARSRCTLRQPGTGPAAAVNRGGASPAARTCAKSRSYPSPASAAPQVGSTSPPVSRAARSAAEISPANVALTRCGSPPAAFSATSSESGLNRLQAASMPASTPSAIARAWLAARLPVTSSTAVVPNTSKVSVVTVSVLIRYLWLRRSRSRGP